jgi:outer membrane protein OmpA-like peptidoglycan-associated protein
MWIQRVLIMVSIGVLVLMVWGTSTNAERADSIGSVAAVQPRVEVIHPGESGISEVKMGAAVLFKDTYETMSQAKLKLLFHDDSILSLGENTRLQIAENVYNPLQGQRRTVINMVNGTVRALVGKVFGGPGSKFEIHTPTAVAAARGTYFIVWTLKQQSLQKEQQRGVVFSFSDILFDSGKALLLPGAQAKLTQVAKILAAYPDHRIMLEGYTDNIGNDAYNQKLSEARAGSVRTALIADGISPDQIATKGYGKSKPVATNATPEGRQQNRRVEMMVFNPSSSNEDTTISALKALLPFRQTGPATMVEEELTGVVNIGESGKVMVSNDDPSVSGSVVLDQGQYTMVAQNKPPTLPTQISQDRFNTLFETTELNNLPSDLLSTDAGIPGSDLSGVAVPSIPSKRNKKGETEMLFPTVPPVLQQPGTH